MVLRCSAGPPRNTRSCPRMRGMDPRESSTWNADPTPGGEANQDADDHDAEDSGLRGLLVRDPYASQLLDGDKIWEIRGRPTHIRGTVLIVKSGTGQIFGTADLVRVLGPLEIEDLLAASELPRAERREFRRSGLPYPKTYAYVFSNPRQFESPIPYRHPSGAVTWVRVPDMDLGAVHYAASASGASEREMV
jgi:hypothetical protein